MIRVCRPFVCGRFGRSGVPRPAIVVSVGAANIESLYTFCVLLLVAEALIRRISRRRMQGRKERLVAGSIIGLGLSA